jgi:hypothetical protein
MKNLFLILILAALVYGDDKHYRGIVDIYLDVAKGNIPGHASVNKFGENPLVGTATDPEDVWAGGGIYNFYPTEAKTCSIVSTSGSDIAAGTGAQTVGIYGLGANWEEQADTATLNGATKVPLTTTWIRLYRAYVITAGTGEVNAGNITVFTEDTVGIYIATGDGQTQQAVYTIPAGKTGYMVKYYMGISDAGGAAGNSCIFKWKSRANDGGNGAWRTRGQIECITVGSSWWKYNYSMPVGGLLEKTDIRIEATEVTIDMGVVGGFDLMLVDD